MAPSVARRSEMVRRNIEQKAIDCLQPTRSIFDPASRLNMSPSGAGGDAPYNPVTLKRHLWEGRAAPPPSCYRRLPHPWALPTRSLRLLPVQGLAPEPAQGFALASQSRKCLPRYPLRQGAAPTPREDGPCPLHRPPAQVALPPCNPASAFPRHPTKGAALWNPVRAIASAPTPSRNPSGCIPLWQSYRP